MPGLAWSRTRTRRTRRLAVWLVLTVALTTFTSAAMAFWSVSGFGTGSASAATFAAPTGVGATSAAGSGQVHVTWSAATGGAAPQGYRVVRTTSTDPTPTPACGTGTSLTTGTSCTDTSVPDGSWTYTVVAVLGSWTATSAGSSPVVVSNTVGSTTTLSSSANPSVTGQQVTYTATVTSASGTPTGSVTFKDGGSAITCANGQPTLGSAGKATCDVTYTSAGSHTVTASYAGAGVVTGSTSDPLTQQVGKAPTTTSLTSSTNPSTAGQTVTFTATVAATGSGAGTPAGTVSFADGQNALGCTGGASQNLSGGTATCQVAFASVSSSHLITAAYAGNADFAASTSSAVSQGVNQAGSTTTLDASPSSATTGQAVTLTATVTVPGSGTPTGTVTFKDGTGTISCGPGSSTSLNTSGKASCLTSFAAAGSHPLTAVYGGDSSYAGSTSPAVAETVTQAVAGTSTALSSSQNPSRTGQTVTYTATVTSGSGTPTGTVTFKDNSTAFTCSGGSQTLDASGRATCQMTYPTMGTHTVTAVYNGSGSWTSSTSGTLTERVVSKDVAGIAFSNVKVNSASATPSCTGSGTANILCTVSGGSGNNGNNAALTATVSFVDASGNLAVYAVDDSGLSYAVTGKTSGSGLVTIAGGQTTSASTLTTTKNGSNSAKITVTWSDGVNSFTASLTVN